jgi:hypothetical protein
LIINALCDIRRINPPLQKAENHFHISITRIKTPLYAIK